MARISGDVTYERVVAHCTLADGTDLSAALAKQGLALDFTQGWRLAAFQTQEVPQ